MSTTTMYVVCPDGSLATFAEYRNGHGSGPQVWSRLAFKYVPNVKDPDSRGFDPTKRHYLFDQTVIPELYQRVDECAEGRSTLMHPYEWRTALAVDDYTIVKPEHLLIYADAMAEFAEVHGPDCEGQVFSIGEQAEDLRRVAARSEEEGWRGVCWRQTSVDDVWDSGEMTDGRKRQMMTETLTAAEIHEGSIPSIVDALINEWAPEDAFVPYNIDIDTRHQWLVGPLA